MDNKKVIIAETDNLGKGLKAVRDIKKGEIIASWKGGKIYTAEKVSDLPKELRDYAIQFDEHNWIDTEGIGRYFNHSCEPNCGVKGRFQIVAMRDIKNGDWLTFDYEMTEDSDWRMDCKCGSKNCRKVIGAYKNMPKEIREKYKGYTSDYLVKKYKL